MFLDYAPHKGAVGGRVNGVLISTENGEAVAYGLWYLEERGKLFVTPGTKVYEGMMCIEIPCSATKFSSKWNANELLDLRFYSFNKYHDLFSQPGGTRWLSMRMGQHGNILPFFCKDL